MMSALMSDVIEGLVTPQVGNATVNAGGKLLKVVEMQAKYGTQNPGAQNRVLDLVGPPTVPMIGHEQEDDDQLEAG